jgi:hypothetical protein
MKPRQADAALVWASIFYVSPAGCVTAFNWRDGSIWRNQMHEFAGASVLTKQIGKGDPTIKNVWSFQNGNSLNLALQLPLSARSYGPIDWYSLSIGQFGLNGRQFCFWTKVPFNCGDESGGAPVINGADAEHYYRLSSSLIEQHRSRSKIGDDQSRAADASEDVGGFDGEGRSFGGFDCRFGGLPKCDGGPNKTGGHDAQNEGEKRHRITGGFLPQGFAFFCFVASLCSGLVALLFFHLCGRIR